MSLHLPFVSLRPGETLGEALERAEPADPALWAVAVAAVTAVLPDADVDDDELVDQASGFELAQDPLSLVVPYGLADDDAADLLLRVVVAVEAATGLSAHDPQTGAPVLAGGAQGVEAAVARTAADDEGDGSGLGAALLRAAVRHAAGLDRP